MKQRQRQKQKQKQKQKHPIWKKFQPDWNRRVGTGSAGQGATSWESDGEALRLEWWRA
jgi:hypothetical protein